MDEFGSLPAVLASRPAALARIVPPATASHLNALHAAIRHTKRHRIKDRVSLRNWSGLLDYLHTTMGHSSIESFRVLFLDVRNGLIRDEVMWEGTVDECSVHVREVIRRAIELGASAVILTHNHPSGDPTPSRADIDMTRAVAEAGKRLGIAVHDHIIIGANSHASLRARSLI